jgi:hypothetical protein
MRITGTRLDQARSLALRLLADVVEPSTDNVPTVFRESVGPLTSGVPDATFEWQIVQG